MEIRIITNKRWDCWKVVQGYYDDRGFWTTENVLGEYPDFAKAKQAKYDVTRVLEINQAVDTFYKYAR
jgi:hypothetical protein